MEETLEGGRGPPRAVVPLERDSITPFIRTPVNRIANYPDLPGPSGKHIQNCTKQLALKLPAIVSSTVESYGFWNIKSGDAERFRPDVGNLRHACQAWHMERFSVAR